MSYPALSAAVARVRRAVTPDPVNETDGELLQRFVQNRDDAAFAELVRRLGPMVLGVCRRVARHHADDAFQAAFVVLARRAADVRPRAAVRGWLYGVAVRTAREARAVSARRLTREVAVAVVPDRAAEPIEIPDADALRILDEEVAGLPDHLRAAVVLCELEGVPRKDAAARLGIPEGTISSRLAKARKLLADRLRKRGIALPASIGVLAHAAVPARLAAQTSAFANPGAAVPTAVAALSNGVFRTMFFQKLLIGAAGLLLAAIAGLAAQTALPDVSAKEPSKSPVPLTIQTTLVDEKKLPAKPVGPGTILLGRAGSYWLLEPDGKKLGELAVPDKTRSHASGVLSPDGKRVAHVVTAEGKPEVQPGGAKWPYRIVVGPLEKPDEMKEWPLPAVDVALCWTPDGKKLIASQLLSRVPIAFTSVVLDPETGATEELGAFRVLECLKDGKTYLVESYDEKKDRRSLALWSATDKEPRVLTHLSGYPFDMDARLSPDGNTVLFIDADPERKEAYDWGCSQRVYLLDVKTKSREKLAGFPEDGQATGIAWSPDGKKIAYAWKQLDEESLKKETINAQPFTDLEAYLIVSDTDGKNPKTIATDRGRHITHMIFGAIDWR